MTTTISATKPSIDTKVGITLNRQSDGNYLVKSVRESSLFENSGLQPGQEIVAINGVKLNGMASDAVLALLANAEGEIALEVKPIRVLQSCHIYCTIENGTKAHMNMNQFRELPKFLRAVGVPDQKWRRILNSFASDLLPVIGQCLTMDQIFSSEMMNYTSKQMAKGYIGFGQESHHERKVYIMTQQAAIQHSNMSMVANNLVTKANALLNMHGVMAELSFTTKTLPKFSTKQKGQNTAMIPTRINFTLI